MKSKYIIAITSVILLLSYGCRTEENVEPTDVTGFIKIIGESVSSPTIAVDMKHHPVEGFVLLASAETNEGGISTFRPKLLQTDHNGYVLWSNTMPEGNWDYRSESLTVIKDDTYLIAGVENYVDAQLNPFSVAFIAKATSNSFNFHRLRYNQIPISGTAKAVALVNGNTYFAVIESLSTPKHSILVEFDLPTGEQEFIDVNWKRDHDDTKTSIVSHLEKTSNLFYWAGSKQETVLRTELSAGFPGEIPDDGGIFPNNQQTEMELRDFFSPGPNIFAFAGMATAGDEKDIRIEYVFKEGLSFTPMISDNLPFDFPGTDIPASISAASDGDLIVLATTDSPDGNGEEDFMLLKIKLTYNATEDKFEASINFPDGQPRYYGGAASETAVAILPDPTGGIVMYGYTEFADVNTLLLMKVKNNGEFE